MIKNQKGFSVVEGLLILTVVGVIGFVGWYVWNRKAMNAPTISSNGSTAQSEVSLATYIKTEASGMPAICRKYQCIKADASIIDATRSTFLTSGFSRDYFDKHFTFINYYKDGESAHVTWGFSLNGYISILRTVDYENGPGIAKPYWVWSGSNYANHMYQFTDVSNTLSPTTVRQKVVECGGEPLPSEAPLVVYLGYKSKLGTNETISQLVIQSPQKGVPNKPGYVPAGVEVDIVTGSCRKYGNVPIAS